MSPAQAETASRQPDIAYTPDFDKYQIRTRQRLAQIKHDVTALPSGFPLKLESELVWEGNNLAKNYDWTYKLDPQDIEELESALKHFKALNVSLGHINQSTFPLSKLHKVLRDFSEELHFGHGFKVLRGVPVTKHSREDNIILYAGLSSHVGTLRGRQDTQYQGKAADVVLAHIKDLTTKHAADIGAPAYTTDKQVFHTDSGDIVSLFALGTAAEGGVSRLASTWRVYNELAATRPDLIETLSQDWIADNFGNPTEPYTKKPLLFFQPGSEAAPERVLLQYARRYFTGFGALPRSSKIPPITEAQAEALDALHYLGERFNVGLDFQQGDIQYVNNLAVFHARDAFKDTPDQQRHLLRLWLRDPEYAWRTPDALKGRWTHLYGGTDPDNQVFPQEPYVRSASNSTSNAQKTSAN